MGTWDGHLVCFLLTDFIGVAGSCTAVGKWTLIISVGKSSEVYGVTAEKRHAMSSLPTSVSLMAMFTELLLHFVLEDTFVYPQRVASVTGEVTMWALPVCIPMHIGYSSDIIGGNGFSGGQGEGSCSEVSNCNDWE